MVGTRPLRPDGVDKVTGRAKFGADLHLPNMLIGKVLRSPHAHARIQSIDTTKAQALPGVKAVMTSADLNDLPSEFVPAGEMLVNYRDITRNVMAGNHDYIYYDINPFNPNEKIAKGKHVVAASGTARRAKIQRFKESFSLPEIFYTKRVGPYQLVFLSTDHLYVSYRTAISDTQMDWLAAELGKNRGVPTIIFFHGPLEGTIGGENLVDNDPANYMAQPQREIRKVLSENPQVFLWVSGHAHIAPTNANFNHPINLYERRVTNIHNPGMNGSSYLSEKDKKGTKHENIWTNSLFLYPDKVVVKTFDHEKAEWMDGLTREVRPPKTR